MKKSNKTFLFSLLACSASLALLPQTASAATIAEVVTPGDLQGWDLTYETRASGTSQINGNLPRNGDGSVELRQIDNANTSLMKASVSRFWSPTANNFSVTTNVGNLTISTFDFIRSSTSLNPSNQSPAYRLYIVNDNNNNSIYGDAGDEMGSLVYEWSNGHAGATPTDSWQTANFMTEKLWMNRTGTGNLYDGPNPYQTLADWMNPLVAKPNNAFAVTANTLIFGVSSSVGSGIAGDAQSGVDNFTLGFAGGNVINTNFEVGAVPEPSTGLLIGLIGTTLVIRRQRQNR